MKALKCEMCGSNDVVKQEDLFVCQNCGTKYSVEAARKMMIEGTVDVKGTVKIDDSKELKNLYELARRAKDTSNCESAKKYYDKILEKEPNSWEASFYAIYFKARTCKDKERNAVVAMTKDSLQPVLELIKRNVSKDQLSEVIGEVYNRVCELTDLFFDANINQYDNLEDQKKTKYVSEDYCENAESITKIMYNLGDKLEIVFGDTFGELVVNAWKYAMSLHENYLEIWGSNYERQEAVECFEEYAAKIKKYEPDYITQNTNVTSRGCYVASAVYGSYNCPQVWTLRRFRDNTLDETWYGRAFIQTYYAISPTLVRWFGETSWFKNLWRKPLDKLVASLRNKGVKDTPYIDKY